MNNELRVRWLRIGAALLIGFGLLVAAAAVPALNAPAAWLLDLIYFPLDGAEATGAPADRLLSAIAGGVMAGWGVMIWLVAGEVYPADPALGRRLVLHGVLTWFVIDSSMSIAAGAPLNVVGKLGFLLVFVIPVWKRSAS